MSVSRRFLGWSRFDLGSRVAPASACFQDAMRDPKPDPDEGKDADTVDIGAVTVGGRDIAISGSYVAGRDIILSGAVERDRVGNLPPAHSFVGRQDALARLQELSKPGEVRRPVVISGQAGVGKTALALQYAHAVAAEYPDGQLYADLDSSLGAVDPESVLGSFLRALGVPEEALPDEPADRVALYRSLLAHRRMLIVLDNAHSLRQIGPILPSGSASTIVVTSRKRLHLGGAALISLDVLALDEALSLLGHRVGEERVRAEPDAAREIVAACDFLPLAIEIAAARIRARPQVSLRHLADHLSDERQRLDYLQVGDLALRASLSLSYEALTTGTARLFTQLAALPTAFFTAEVAAVFTDQPHDRIVAALSELEMYSLLLSLDYRHYAFRDLLRAFAAERSGAPDAQHRSESVRRLLSWYLDRARSSAEQLTAGHSGPSEAIASQRADALAWLETERPNFPPLLEHGAEAGFPEYVWKISDCLFSFYLLRRHFSEWRAVHEVALQAARSASDAAAETRGLINLGVVHREERRFADALACFEQSHAIARNNGDAESQSLALMNLGVVHHGQGRSSEAIACYDHALALARDLGDAQIRAQTLLNLGNAEQDLGNFTDSETAYRTGIELARAHSDLHSEGVGLMNLGALLQRARRPEDARVALERSLEVARMIGDAYDEGRALRLLGAVHLELGSVRKARIVLEKSLDISDGIGDLETTARTAMLLGQSYEHDLDYAEAAAWYARSLEVTRRLQDSEAQARTLHRIAVVASRVGDTEEALAAYAESIDLLAGEVHTLPLLAELFAEQGELLRSVGQLAKSIDSFERSAAIARDAAHPPLEAAALRELCALYDLAGDEAASQACRTRIKTLTHGKAA
jgi:tetratricopeptide (TPR) repeat protein